MKLLFKLKKMEIVYLFRQIGTNYVKIGMTASTSCEERFNSFKTYSPLGAEIVGTIRTRDALKLERELHKKYAYKRLSGEFFDLTDEDCESILNLDENNIVNDLINKVRVIESAGDLESIHKLLMNANSFINKIETGIYDDLLALVLQEFEEADEYNLTPTEIANYLNEKHDLEINVVKLGMSLTKKFKNRRVRRGAKVQNMYKLRLIK